jgi:hypothetical protein
MATERVTLLEDPNAPAPDSENQAAEPAGRVVTNVLAVSAVNDWLQAGFRALCEQANR